MTGLTLYVPQRHRISLRLVVEPRHPGNPLGDLALGVARGAKAAQVTLDVGGEHRHAGIAESFGHSLQRHGFSGAGRARDQTVAIGQAHSLGNRLPFEVGADNELQ
ncbi:hypothetical protein D9M71_254210 [compost metagenome]